MPNSTTAVVQGTLDMLILKTLSLRPMHAYGIALRIKQISEGVFDVNAGSLFPAFKRLERAGWLSSQWQTSDNNRRAKYYTLTPSGKKQLKAETRDWEMQAIAISRILEA
jgi:transcriptional regulator